jgi:8-oxo-dGTP diphosphatase
VNHATPSLAVDLVIVNVNAGVLYAIKRKFPPLGLALPGGFVEIGETCETAALREAEEETSLKLERLFFVGVYDDPKRDPRKHVVSVAYIARTDETPKAGDDAAEIVEIPLADAISFCNGQMYEAVGVGEDGIEICAPPPPPPDLQWCFDHARISKDAYGRFDYMFRYNERYERARRGE